MLAISDWHESKGSSACSGTGRSSIRNEEGSALRPTLTRAVDELLRLDAVERLGSAR